MNPEEIGQILDEIGQRVGPYGEAAWEILVTQKFAEGLIGTIMSAIGIVASIALAVLIAVATIKIFKQEASQAKDHSWKSDPDPMIYAMTAMLPMLIPMLLFAISFGSLPSSIMRMINPQYYALVKLLETLP